VHDKEGYGCQKLGCGTEAQKLIITLVSTAYGTKCCAQQPLKVTLLVDRVLLHDTKPPLEGV